MTWGRRWGAAIAAVIVGLGMAGSIDAQDTSARFVGTVTIDAEPADTGSAVVAMVDGEVCGSATAIASAVGSTYVLDVPGSCASAGAVVSFSVNGYPAAETAMWVSGGRRNLDLTVNTSQGGAQTTTAVEVTVWRRVSDASLLYVSTRPEGGRWRTQDMALDMSALSDSGRFYQSNAVRVEIRITTGSAAVDVTVWRRVSNPSLLYVSTRPEGGRWRTLDTALDMSALSDSGRFYQSNAVRVEVALEANAVPTPTPDPILKPFRGRGCIGATYGSDVYCSGIEYRARLNTLGEFVTIVDTSSTTKSADFNIACYDQMHIFITDWSVPFDTELSQVSRLVEYTIDSSPPVRSFWDQRSGPYALWAPNSRDLLEELRGASRLSVQAFGERFTFEIRGMTSTPAQYNIEQCGIVSVAKGFSECHPDYQPCIPNFPGDVFDCDDLEAFQKPVQLLNRGVDPYRLDEDGDGWACELPK